MMELDTEIHLKADYPETKERILLKSENISNMFKKDIDNPYKMFIELERLKSKELENSKEYEIISDTINNPSIKFNINNSNVEILKRANDREELIDYIVDKMGEKSSHKIENLVGQFEEERNKDFSNDKEFLKSLNELPFEKMKMLKDFKEFYNENRFDSMEKIQDNFIDSLDDKKLQSKYNKLFNDEPHIVHKFINANETNVVKDIVNSADNPLVCIAKLEELKVSDSLDMKTSVISDIKDYIAVQSESIKDKIIEQATRKNVETASVLDMEMFKQMIENNGIEARTIIFQDLVNKNTSVVNDKEVVEYIVNEEQRSYCNERKEVLEVNFATDEQVSSIEKRAGRSRRGLSKEESKELFKDNFGCLYGVAETRAEHLAQVTFDIKETVDNLNNIYNMMKKHGIEASENSALYKKNTETFVEVNKEILDLISSEKNVRTEIIEVDRALEYNSCTIKYPNKEKLHEKMISIEKEINDREQRLSELKETNYDGKLSLSRLYSNAKSYFANKGNKTLSDNNSEILMIERELDSLRSKYLETQQAYTNSHIIIETLKNDIQRENNKIFQEYKEACDILNINTGFIDKLINDMAKRDKDNDAIINVPVTTEFRQSISKLEKGEIQFMDLSNEDISILNKLVDSVREYKLQNENLSQEELHKIININISLDVAETVTQCREKNEFVLLTQYKEELKNLLENREKVTSQEFSQIIDLAYGYSHTTNADIERLNMIYLQCEISFDKVSECRRLLQNLDKSLLEPGTTSSENIVKAVAELNDAIEQHNKNIASAEETVTNELIAEINKQILVEAGLSHEIRQEILSEYNGEYVNIHYGQDVHKEYMNKVELDSVLAELKSEELREQIKLYKEKEAYQNKIREVIYGKDEHIDNEEPSLDASKQDKEEKKKEEERNKEQEAKIKSREASNDSLQR
jgi:hypothetical protein